jgi:hypothetical protein
MALDYLEHPEKLEEMRQQLRAVRGQPGAAQKLAELVITCRILLLSRIIFNLINNTKYNIRTYIRASR